MGRNLVDIGDRAYSARVNKRIKQEHLSESLGIAQSSYSRFENGTYDMPITKIMELCDLLDISVMWLLYGK